MSRPRKQRKGSPRRGSASASIKGPPPYAFTDRERALTAAYVERRDRSAPFVRFKVTTDGNSSTVRVDHPNPALEVVLLAKAFATADHSLASELTLQLAGAARTGEIVKPNELNFAIAAVNAIGPRDETEALLAAQMAAVHIATMAAAQRLASCETIPQQDSASTMLNKCARTFAAQLEALKRYRSTGTQEIRVQHVNVHDGGRAIVTGSMQTGGGDTGKGDGQPHEPGAPAADGPALHGHVETLAAALPGAGGDRLDRVPVPRSPRRSAQGKG